MVFVPPHDRVLEHSTSNSQTVFAVTGAVDTSFNAFSAFMSIGDTTIGGVVEPGTAFASGILTYSAANQVTVTTVKESKGTFSSSGTKEVFMGQPAASALLFDGPQSFAAAPQRQLQSNAGLLLALRSYLAGLTLSTAGSSATFGVAAGVAMDSTNASVMSLASAFSKTTSAWAAGTGAGSLDTSTIAANTWYYVYLIQNLSTGAVDILISLSSTSPTLPSGYTVSRRIGSMLTDGSSHWSAFFQTGDTFEWVTPVLDLNITTLGTSGVLVTLTVPRFDGMYANIKGLAGCASAGQAHVYATQIAAVNGNSPTVAFVSGTILNSYSSIVRVNSSGQVSTLSSQASTILTIGTYSWIDRRGRDN
jgi:hypothetical protein